MPARNGGKRLSIDEYLAGYAKRKKKTVEESVHGEGFVEGAIRRKREEMRVDHEHIDEARREGHGPDHDLGPEEAKAADAYDTPQGVREVVKSKPLIFFTYLLRAFAISAMAFLMLFIILRDVMKKKPVIDYFSSVGDTFGAFLSDYLVEFVALLLAIFLLQACYYAFHRIATRKWKAYAREEIAYSIAFALAGLIGSAGIAYALNLY